MDTLNIFKYKTAFQRQLVMHWSISRMGSYELQMVLCMVQMSSMVVIPAMSLLDHHSADVKVRNKFKIMK